MPREDGQWKPGNSGNPGGRPRSRTTWAAILARIGREKNASGEPRKLRVARVLWRMAEAMDLDAIRLLMERMDGKPPQPIANDATGAFIIGHVLFEDSEPGADPDDSPNGAQ